MTKRRVWVACAAGLFLAACTGTSDEDDGAAPSPPAPSSTPDSTRTSPQPGSPSVPPDRTPQPPPSGTPAPDRTLEVVAPDDGSTVSSPVVVEVEVSGFSLVDLGGDTREDEGHLHAFVDEVPPDDQVWLRESPSIVTSADATIELGELAAGEHTVTVVATYSYPVPFEPRVEDGVTFVVQ
ncbi:hypothetical protein [Haloactinopolyspora alba]|uniref:hypothetical protein n=1 Tax=Haloactinopolyspora alba TaxID=648780 RepID=UPI00101DEC2C|nr:hypothetical protein [Haloactinopolyspora alba]